VSMSKAHDASAAARRKAQEVLTRKQDNERTDARDKQRQAEDVKIAKLKALRLAKEAAGEEAQGKESLRDDRPGGVHPAEEAIGCPRLAKAALIDAEGGKAEVAANLGGDDGKGQQTSFQPDRGAAEMQAKLAFVKEGQQIAVLFRSLSYDEKLKECPRIALDLRVGAEAEALHALWEDDITVRVATDPVKLKYNVANFYMAVTKLAQTNLRNIVGDMALDESLTSREPINAKLRMI